MSPTSIPATPETTAPVIIVPSTSAPAVTQSIDTIYDKLRTDYLKMTKMQKDCNTKIYNNKYNTKKILDNNIPLVIIVSILVVIYIWIMFLKNSFYKTSEKFMNKLMA